MLYLQKGYRKGWVQHVWHVKIFRILERLQSQRLLWRNTSHRQGKDAIRDVFGSMFEAMPQGEVDSHLGYGSNGRGEKETTNRRNGYSHKSVSPASIITDRVIGTAQEWQNRPLKKFYMFLFVDCVYVTASSRMWQCRDASYTGSETPCGNGV